MKTFISILILISLVSVNAQTTNRFINVNGTAELILRADQVKFTVHIKSIDNTIEESKKNNDKLLNNLLEMLNETGIKKEDIEISPITLGKNYTFLDGERRHEGFYAAVVVFFTLNDMTKYYDLTNVLASDNELEVSSQFMISDYEDQHKLAYKKALEAAKEKAEYMSKTLGLSLGEVLEIDENSSQQFYPNPFNTSTREISTDVNSLGNVTIKRSIRVKFALN